MTGPLEDALREALSATAPGALAAALARAWAAHPTRRLKALALAAARQARGQPLGEGLTSTAREASWRAEAERAGRAALPALLATPWSRRPADALARLRWLEALGPDPRTANALLELDTGARFASGAGFGFWRRAYAVLLGWGDLDAAERVQRFPPPAGHATAWEAVRFRDLFEPLGREWLTRWPREPPTPPAVEERLSALEARLAPREGAAAALLATVHAAPAADGPRLVLADALAERGDPRGEFIALQYAHERGELTQGKRERMRQLLAAAGLGWFDGLAGQVDPRAVFRRGHLSEVRLTTREPDARAPAWRTVEVLDTGGLALPLPLSRFLASPNLAGVRALRSTRAATFAELAREGGARELELVELSLLDARPLLSPRFSTRALRLLAPPEEAMAWLAATNLGGWAPKLELTTQAAHAAAVGGVVARVERESPAVERLTVACAPQPWPRAWVGAWQLSFTRVEGRLSSLEVLCVDEQVSGLGAALGSLAARQLRRVRVRAALKRGPAWRASVEATLQRALSGQLALEARDVQLTPPIALPPGPVLAEGR